MEQLLTLQYLKFRSSCCFGFLGSQWRHQYTIYITNANWPSRIDYSFLSHVVIMNAYYKCQLIDYCFVNHVVTMNSDIGKLPITTDRDYSFVNNVVTMNAD